MRLDLQVVCKSLLADRLNFQACPVQVIASDLISQGLNPQQNQKAYLISPTNSLTFPKN